MNIFAQIVYTMLDSLGCQVGSGISLAPRVLISFVLAYLTNIFSLSKSRLKTKTLTRLDFACAGRLKEADYATLLLGQPQTPE